MAKERWELGSSTHEDIHAGEIETSILLHVHPELIRDGYEAADGDRRRQVPPPDDRHGRVHPKQRDRPTISGSADKGKAVLASLVDSFASVLEILRNRQSAD